MPPDIGQDAAFRREHLATGGVMRRDRKEGIWQGARVASKATFETIEARVPDIAAAQI